MIQKIIRLKNDMVMVFDENGEQMAEYQGFYKDVRDKILQDAPSGAVFNHWFGHSVKPLAVVTKKW
jgi:hypothetical protein